MEEKTHLLNADNIKTNTYSDLNEHCHDFRDKHKTDQKAKNKLIVASVLCVIFMIIEATGGIIAGSLAVATDAAHLLTDFFGFMISLFAIYIAQKPATNRFNYGYHRAEIIGALVSVLLIWIVTGILVFMAFQRLNDEDYDIDANVMLITSGVGIIFNLIMGCSLHEHSHGTSIRENNCSQTENGKGTIHAEKDTKQNINVRAALIHVIGDFIQSIGVFAAALLIYFMPEAKIADPICTFIFSLIVIATTLSIIKDTFAILMEGKPKDVDFYNVQKCLLNIPRVKNIHNLRIWSISPDVVALSVHIAIENESLKGKEILKIALKVLRSFYRFSEVTIQLEEFNIIMVNCQDCLHFA